jgi:DNA-binding MarR family transcriptional regulator
MTERAHKHHSLIEMVDEVVRMSGRLKSIFAHVNSGAGLSSMENTVLAAVVEASTPPTVPQIGRSLGHPRQVIQRAVNSLIEEGIIETRPNPEHKRARLLVPTLKGGQLKAKAHASADEIVLELFRRLEPGLCERVTSDLHSARSVIEDYLRARKS